jgi:aryl-alcohol dehydrogenase-like predicted oxidoreductase
MRYSGSISRMTLGTVQLGLHYGIANKEGKPDQDKAFRIMDSALASGITCFDTAADYGDSEKVIGKYLESSGKRSSLSVVTKFKLGSLPESAVEKAMMKSVENSLANLKTDYLDVLLLHDANEFSAYGKIITGIMRKLLAEGTVKMAGASCYSFGEIEPMLSDGTYQAFQIPVNLLDMRITRSYAEKLADKLVFARSVFLQGLFFMEPSTLKGNLKEIDTFVEKIHDLAEELNITVSQLAVQYVNSLSYVNSLVIGTDNPVQVSENAAIFDLKPLDKETTDKIEGRLMGAPDWLFMPWIWDKQR